jgi:hypothetical protein
MSFFGLFLYDCFYLPIVSRGVIEYSMHIDHYKYLYEYNFERLVVYGTLRVTDRIVAKE